MIFVNKTNFSHNHNAQLLPMNFFSTTNFSSLYPNTSKIINIILVIPLSNASVERVFSRQNLIKNKLQNKIKLETLYFYLNILINNPSLNLFDFEAAYITS